MPIASSRRQEDVARRDLVGLERPAEEGVLAEALDLLGRERGRDQRRPDRARGDRVDADPALLEVAGERAGEGDDRALGRGVVDQMRAAAIGGDRGGVDDRSAVRRGAASAALVRWNMAKMLVRKVRSSCAAVMSSSRSCGCCSAALLTRRSRRPKASTACATALAAEALVADVARDRDARRPSSSISARVERGVVVLVEIEDRDVGALLGEADRDRAADPAVAAGDQRDLARELAGAAVVPHLGARRGASSPPAARAGGPAPGRDDAEDCGSDMACALSPTAARRAGGVGRLNNNCAGGRVHPGCCRLRFVRAELPVAAVVAGLRGRM